MTDHRPGRGTGRTTSGAGRAPPSPRRARGAHAGAEGAEAMRLYRAVCHHIAAGAARRGAAERLYYAVHGYLAALAEAPAPRGRRRRAAPGRAPGGGTPRPMSAPARRACPT